MFDFLRRYLSPSLYSVYYTYGIGTYVLRRVVAAKSEYEANRLFDLMMDDGNCRRLPNATCKIDPNG
jgi:hypothetical protein